MPYELTGKLAKLKPYDPVEGEYKIRLDANESFCNINEALGGKLAAEISKISLNRYPDPLAGDVIKAFGGFYGIPEKYITAGNGSDELISVITSCFLETGDTILTVSPDFSMYAFYGSLYELKVETIQKEDDLTINVAKLIEYANRNNVKAIIFSNPCNPTSLGITREEVIRLIENVFCLVIVDEAYMDFWTESVLDAVSQYDNLIVLKTCSKALGLAAIRLGFAVAGETVTNALRAAKSPYNTDTISQTIGRVILSEKQLLKDTIDRIVASRNDLYAKLRELSARTSKLRYVYEPKTNFVFIRTDLAEELFEGMLKRSIAIRFMGGYLRITAGTAEENEAVVSAIAEILNIE